MGPEQLTYPEKVEVLQRRLGLSEFDVACYVGVCLGHYRMMKAGFARGPYVQLLQLTAEEVAWIKKRRRDDLEY